MHVDGDEGRPLADIDAPVRDDPALCDGEAVARASDTDPARGLTDAEAARRLAAEGPNALRPVPPIPVWRRMLAQFEDPLVYLLLGAVAVAVAAWLIEGRIGWPIDALVITLIIVLNAGLGFLQQARAAHAVAALSRMTEVSSTVLRQGVERRVPSAQLVRGDLLVLAEGDAVGAAAPLRRAPARRLREA